MKIQAFLRAFTVALLPSLFAVQGCSGMANAGVKSGDRVLVAGATGRTGRLVIQDLATHGFRVKALVRDVAKGREALGDGVEYVTGDVRDRKSLDAAMHGVKAVVSAVGATRDDPANAPEFVDYGGVKNLAEAAAAAGVRQIVLISSAGVTQKDNVLNRLFKNILIWKFKGEEAVRASGVPYTIIRPGGLTDQPGGQKALVFQQGDKSTGSVSRADVAAACREALKHPSARNRTFELTNGAADEPVNWEQLFGSLKPDQG